ncbi:MULTISPECIES: PTS fructose transporter subunit IIB [Bacteria]|jgi:PTS system fructose-specific IIB component|uniref:PTS fructose transporter subunit IIB n=1 Tax=Staphylococcus shinii TaxID=2912228 RepID=A0A418IE34_9STAP|nr:PTS fructose transporter subunit IIB [Staphylococcus shinii]RNH97718.1 PTS fructose transporter subunit IIB [Acinetobacter baumannii]MBO3064989.1 PTS fructose transporter subunit IIB [Staphylococcus shinii]MDW8566812.1 PTS fructose transporter subunit IIB [Staphylococcus shinii]MDW8571682.1 PTS fructose transporter subunit IIB [Staphylococcus shinii]MEC5301539.1 PTS fructose transporter subunit IIB [Staphylococcus shinii]
MNIVSVCACTVGIAHTYIAAEKLEQAAKKKGHLIQIETQGTIGSENELTEESINNADIVLLAVDVKISNKERFDGKKIVEIPTDLAIKSPNKLIEKIEEIAASKS